MKNEHLPPAFENVWVTFTDKHGKQVTLKGFYTPIFEEFAIPPNWIKSPFGNYEVPDGWGGKHLKPHQIISWEKIE